MLQGLIAMTRDNEDRGEEYVVRNVESLTHLLDWLPDIEDNELQVHVATVINKLCSSSLQRFPTDKHHIFFIYW